MRANRRRDLNLGITGASGARFAVAALRALTAHPEVGTVRTVVSDHVWDNLRTELGRPEAPREELEQALFGEGGGGEKIVRYGARFQVWRAPGFLDRLSSRSRGT